MIECYFKWCQHHCFNHKPDEGPYCTQAFCKASAKELKIFSELRKRELNKYDYESNNSRQ